MAGSGMVLLLKVLVSAFVLVTPVVGVWVASSLVAYRGGALWVPVLAGLAVFPVAPVAWDIWSEWRRKQKRPDGERILTVWDRLLLRTFAVSFVLVAALLWAQPEKAFEALSTRGDWMLDGRQSKLAATARHWLFGAAHGLEWLYDAAHEDPFAELAPEDANRASGEEPKPDERPSSQDGPSREPGQRSTASKAPQKSGRTAEKARESEPSVSGGSVGQTDPGAAPAREPVGQPAPAAPAKPIIDVRSWPAPRELHPVVASMPRAEETSLLKVARYIASREEEPFARVKALHDWVTDRISYDAEAVADGRYPPQDAQAVFRRRTAVCAGYAMLLQALARAIGQDMVYVTGDARTAADGGGEGHAWNAVKIDGQWYLIDATWDAGSIKGRSFVKNYRTAYFLVPPEVIGVTHFPSVQRWQLREPKLTRGEFMRQPLLRPEFYVRGFQLRSPDRSQVDVDAALDIVVDNPRGHHLLATIAPPDAQATDCSVEHGPMLRAHCPVAAPGVFQVTLFAGDAPYGRFEGVGTVQAVRR